MTDTTTKTSGWADAIEQLKASVEARLATLEAQLETEKANHQGEPAPQNRSYAEVTIAELEAMKEDVKEFLVTPPRPTLTQISAFFWETFRVGQSGGSEVIPMTKATAIKVLTKVGLKSAWDRISYRA